MALLGCIYGVDGKLLAEIRGTRDQKFREVKLLDIKYEATLEEAGTLKLSRSYHKDDRLENKRILKFNHTNEVARRMEEVKALNADISDMQIKVEAGDDEDVAKDLFERLKLRGMHKKAITDLKERKTFRLKYEECKAHESLVLQPGIVTLSPESFLKAPVMWVPVATIESTKTDLLSGEEEVKLDFPIYDCSFESEAKGEGILYWLGTSRGINATYSSPLNLSNCVVGTCKSTTYGTAVNAFARPHSSVTAVSCYIAAAEAPGWFMIEFKTNTVRPTHFTLRTDSNGIYAPRNFELQGSNDGKDFTAISTHVSDTKIVNTSGQMGSWPVEVPQTSSATSFRFLKLAQTGNNAYGDLNFMVNGFEVYGTVYDLDA